MLAVLAVSLVASSLGETTTVTDARGRAVTLRSTSRIVTLGGSITETVDALGRFGSVVGVDKSSLHPPEVKQKPGVGYFRAFSAEGVLSLGPTLVLAEEGSGPKAAIDQLESAGIPVVVLSGQRSIDGAKARVSLAAEVLGVPGEGTKVIQRIEREIEDARKLVAQARSRPRVLFIYARAAGTLNVAGSGTGADEIVLLAGGTNAVTGFEGYRPLTSEAVVKAAPDVLLVTEHGLRSLGGATALLEVPGIAHTPAGAKRRIVVMDDLLLLGFGPRVGAAVSALAKELHPELVRSVR